MPVDAHVVRRDNVGGIAIVGRKHFAMTACEGFLHVTGGTNQFGNLLEDIWTYNTRESEWKELGL